jgi:hypothetical protein
MKLGRCLFAILLILRAVPAAADTLTDLFPPDTNVVFGIRVHNLAISSVVQSFAAEAKAAAAGWMKAIPLGGFDLLLDIDEVLIASSGKGPNPPAIVVVTGHFDVARLTQGAKRYYHDVPLWGGEKASGGAVALLGPGTALLGDATMVRAAIDRRGGQSRIDPALNDRITSLRQRYDIWGLGEKQEGFASPLPEAKALESIDRFQFGVQLANGLDLGAEIHTRSPEDAEKLSAALGMMAAMVTGSQKSTSAAKFDAKVDGGTLKLSLFVPEEELKKAIQAQTAVLSQASVRSPAKASLSITGAEAPESGPNSPPEASPAAPSAPSKAAAPQAATSPAAPTPVAAPQAATSQTAPTQAAAPQAATSPSAPTPAAAPKPAASKVPDKDRDTVVFTLPGKK